MGNPKVTQAIEKLREDALRILIATALIPIARSACVWSATATGIIAEATARVIQSVLIFAACFASGWLLCDMRRNK